jgi:hypothetical protein
MGESGQTILAINTTRTTTQHRDAAGPDGPERLHPGRQPQRDAPERRAHDPREPGGHSLWYSWTGPSTGTAQVSGYSYDFNPAVAAYTGTSFGNLNLVVARPASGHGRDDADASQCLCTFSATEGTTYLITVDGETSNDVGEFTLSIDDSQWQAPRGTR